MTSTDTAMYDHRNWNDYLKNFSNRFKYLDAELTDPHRFPKDSRDDNGFWFPYKVYAVWGYFCCPENNSCFWESKEIQVDVMFRYNFQARQGEVKIYREYRQRCPQHGGPFVSPLVGEKGGAKWIMVKTAQYIMKRFYGGGAGVVSLTSKRTRNSTGSSVSSLEESSRETCGNSGPGRTLPLYKPVASHYRENCEACLLRRCPIPRRDIPDWDFMVRGTEINSRPHLTFITWCLLDNNDTPYDVLSLDI